MSLIKEIVPNTANLIVTEVASGAATVLNCTSNDWDHNFMFWLFGDNKVVGPDNHFDERKYKYEVLSGNLHIDSVTAAESGYYKCISRKVDSAQITVGDVKMLVTGSSFSTMDAVNLVAVIVSVTVLISCAIIYFRLRKEWRKYDKQAFVSAEDEDDGENEIYNQTTTSINQPVPGPSRNHSSEHLIYGIDNQGLDTDFNSVFENIQIKSPQSLI